MGPNAQLALVIISNLSRVVAEAAEQDRDVTKKEMDEAQKRAENTHNTIQDTD